MRRLLLPLLLLLIVAVGCSRRSDNVVPVDIARFDMAVTAYAGMDSCDRGSFRQQYAPVIGMLRGLMSLPDSIDADDELIAAYSGSRGMNVFGRAVADSLPDLTDAAIDLARGRDRLLEWTPDFVWPEIYGVISTYNHAVLTSDTTVCVALNHFLGEDYDGYSYFDKYQRRLKRPDMIAPMTMQAIVASRYPYKATPDATVISRMVYDGALVLATALSVEGDGRSADEITRDLLGWTPEQWMWARDNESLAWNRLIEQDMIYSTDMTVADRLTRQSPSTPLLHPQAPGRMGTYLGMMVAKSWLDRNDGAVPTALLDSVVYNSPSLLIDSRYVPSSPPRR